MLESYRGSGLSSIQIKYDVGDVYSSKKLVGGLVNDLYLFETSKGKFVYKQFRYSTPSLLEKEQNLLRFLEGHFFPVPHIIQRRDTRNGLFSPSVGYLYEYVDGYCPREPNTMTDAQLQEAGHALGTYHALIEEYPFQTANGFHYASRSGSPEAFYLPDDAKPIWNNVLRVISHKGSLQVIDLQMLEVAQAMLRGIESYDYSSLNNLMKRLPRIFVHGDYQGTNLVFGENDVLKAVLDWENAGRLTRVGEVLYAVTVMSKIANTENFNTPLDLERSRIFLEAYSRHINLSEEEINAMPSMAYATSLATPFLLQVHYFDNESRLDKFFPQHIEDWFWWKNNNQAFFEMAKQALAKA